MTTTTNHTTDHADDTHDSPTPGKLEKVKSLIAGHLFTIYLIVAVLVAILLLQANGFQGPYTYTDAMRWVIGPFNVAFMIYPAILAFMNIGKQQYAAARLVIIAVTVVITFFAMPTIVLGAGGIGAALWAVPVIGPIILPPLAVVLHAAAALMLTRYAPKGENTVAEDKAKIPGLKASIAEAKGKHEAAITEAKTYEDTEAEAKVKSESLTGISQELAEVFKDAKKEHEESSATALEADLKKRLKANEELQLGIVAAMQAKQLELQRSGTTQNLADRLKAEISDLDADLGTAQVEATQLNADIEAAQAAIDVSAEKVAMQAALTASEPADAAALEAQEDYEAATKAAKPFTVAAATQGEVVKNLEELLKDTEAHIAEATKAGKGGWHSVVFGPIAALGASFFLLYSVWYGWVVTTVAFIPVG